MKYNQYIKTCLVLFSFFILKQTAAQKDSLWRQTGKWSAWGVRYQTQTFGISENNLDTCNCGEGARSVTQRGNVGLLVSYYKSVNQRFAYSFNLGASYGRIGTKETPTLLAKEKLFTSFRADAYYHVGKEKQLIMPYLHSGLNVQLGSVYGSIPLGAGMRWMMRKSPIFFTAQLDYGVGFTSKLRNNLIGALGVYMNLGADRKQPLKKTPQPDLIAACNIDSDGDGVMDTNDLCPKLKGNQANGGCPVCDTDGDGIVDDKDKCPTIPGSLANEGCPVMDTDGDGVIDSKDQCPTVPGKISNMGCPMVDTDGDGIPDAEDACISVAGKAIFKGCPEDPNAKQVIRINTPEVPQVIVYFDLDKYAITNNAQLEVDKAIKFLKTYNHYNVILTGHADLRASASYNEELSRKRVEVVKQKLVDAGIGVERITSNHYGENVPAQKGGDEYSFSKNRRVEFQFINTHK